MAEIDALSKSIKQSEELAGDSDIARQAHYYATFGHELAKPAALKPPVNCVPARSHRALSFAQNTDPNVMAHMLGTWRPGQ